MASSAVSSAAPATSKVSVFMAAVMAKVRSKIFIDRRLISPCANHSPGFTPAATSAASAVSALTPGLSHKARPVDDTSRQPRASASRGR